MNGIWLADIHHPPRSPQRDSAQAPGARLEPLDDSWTKLTSENTDD